MLIALAFVAAACGDDSPAGLTGIVREPVPQVGAVTFPDGAAGGADFSTKAAEGELLLVYFGYTACPDVCPTTLADLRGALRDLGEEASRVDVAFITIDPGRDSPERLTEYVQAFVADGHSLVTDDPVVLREAADVYGADYGVTELEDGTFDVFHTAFLYVVDAEGRLIVQWPFGTPSEDMTADLAFLFAEGV